MDSQDNPNNSGHYDAQSDEHITSDDQDMDYDNCN